MDVVLPRRICLIRMTRVAECQFMLKPQNVNNGPLILGQQGVPFVYFLWLCRSHGQPNKTRRSNNLDSLTSQPTTRSQEPRKNLPCVLVHCYFIHLSKHSMASPPRRMTRARAKKEGFEPDWRINPNWKTPKKSKSTVTKLDLSQSNTTRRDGKEHIVAHVTSQVPSPLKIRVAAKLPPPSTVDMPCHKQQTLPSSSNTTASSTISSPSKESKMGSPIRVRPRTTAKITAMVDKENSPLPIIMAVKYSSPPKFIPQTESLSPTRVEPLQTTPAEQRGNIQPSVKVLSTPIRILNTQTPRRYLGNARRIPVRHESKLTKNRNESAAGTDAAPAASRNAGAATRLSPTKLQAAKHYRSDGQTFVSFASAKLDVLQLSGDFGFTSKSHKTTPKRTPRSSDSSGQVPAHQPPTRLHNTPRRHPPLPTAGDRISTMRNSKLYIDEKPKTPVSSDLNKGSSKIPGFPDRHSPIDLSSPVPSHPARFTSMKELKPKVTRSPWRTPVKGVIHTPAQSVRKVCFRTPSPSRDGEGDSGPDSGDEENGLIESPSAHRTSIGEKPKNSLMTPVSAFSPKVFDLSDTDNSTYDLFTPRKSRSSKTLPTNSLSISDPAPISGTDAKIERGKIYELSTPAVPTGMDSGPDSIGENGDNIEPVSFVEPVCPPGQGILVDKSMPISVSSDLESHEVYESVSLSRGSSLQPSYGVSDLCLQKPMAAERDYQMPLHGVVAFVDVKTSDGDDASAPFVETLKKLGARVAKYWNWSGDDMDKVGITHVIFKQGGPRTLAKVKLARGRVKCVSLGWISR